MIIVFALVAVFIFGFLVAIHEVGHFLAARLCGVRVNEFSIGMGPCLWHRETDETQYSIRLLPIGGFCALEGAGRGLWRQAQLYPPEFLEKIRHPVRWILYESSCRNDYHRYAFRWSKRLLC